MSEEKSREPSPGASTERGPPLTDPQESVDNIIEIPSYLLPGSAAALPERIDSQLEFVKSLRAARVKSFAARTLGDVSPETLRLISEYLNKDIDLHPGGEQAAVIAPEDTEDGHPEAP